MPRRRTNDVYENAAAFPVQPERITLAFGATTWPYSTDSPHVGLDVAPYAGSFGAPVYAPVSGQVVDVALDDGTGTGKGNMVIIRERLDFDLLARTLQGKKLHVPAGSRVSWVLAHLAALEVDSSAEVLAGDRVGTVGATGYSFGPHVHVELRAYDVSAGGVVYLNPLDYLYKRIQGLASRVTWANA